jgi:hypothetical protein
MEKPTGQRADLSAKGAEEPAATKEGDAYKTADWWVKEIGRSCKHWEPYYKRARKVEERYRDERDTANAAGAIVSSSNSGGVRFNILYANVETLRSAVYSNSPIPDVRRRFADKDVVGRVAADVLQRCVSYSIEPKPDYDFGAVLGACNEDTLLPGFAVARAVYKPYFQPEPVNDESGQPVIGPDGKPVMQDRKVYEEATCAYIQWDMFAMSRVKRYDKVWWVAYAIDMTEEEVRIQFGPDVAASLTYQNKENINGSEVDTQEGCNTVRVWEGWDKRARKRFFVSEGASQFLMPVEDDPLHLEGMFPNPKPIWTVSTNRTMIPIPEYCMYQDLALELDNISQRIQILIAALKRRGVYAQKYANTLGDVANAASDNCFVPIEEFQQFMQDGGLEKLLAEAPLDKIAQVILQLYSYREQTKQIIYEITGIADIIRGSSQASETATAQRIKGQWAGLRLQARKQRFAEFARDLIRLKAEIIAEHFSEQTMALISGVDLFSTQAEKQQAIQARQAMEQQAAQAQQQQATGQGQQQPPAPQVPPLSPEEKKKLEMPTWEEVLGILRNDKLRGFKIDIETDSTIQADADAEKQARTEFLQALGNLFPMLAQAVQQGTMPLTVAKELLMFGTRAFRVGSSLEQALDEWGSDESGESVEQKKAQQMIQQKEQELGEREAKVKDAEHQAQLAAKDAQLKQKDLEKAELQLDYRERILALEKEVMTRVDSAIAAHMQRQPGEELEEQETLP